MKRWLCVYSLQFKVRLASINSEANNQVILQASNGWPLYDKNFIRAYSESLTAVNPANGRQRKCLCLEQRPYADADKTGAGDIVQVFLTDVLGNNTTRKHTDGRSHDKCQRSTEKHGELADFFVCCKQHGSQLGFIAELSNKNRGENRKKHFVFQGNILCKLD